jgi:hypothetical protein
LQQERALSNDDQINAWRDRETNLGMALVSSACKLLQSQVRGEELGAAKEVLEPIGMHL